MKSEVNDNISGYELFTIYLREAAKKILFLVARPLRSLAPPPFGLVAIGTFLMTVKKLNVPNDFSYLIFECT